jgi:hypothetical protein
MENPTMTTSESISNIAAALAKAQGAFKPINRNRTVEVNLKDGKGKYTFAYATLDSVIDATREALSANGICQTAMVNNGAIVVKLYHSSGEWFGASVPVPPVSAGWQAFGSAITYARRYLLTPLLGVASEEDDDGNAAEGNEVSNGPDPLQPLWDALDKTDIPKRGPTAVRDWCEIVLGRPVPHQNTIFPKDLPVLMAALAHDTEKPTERTIEKPVAATDTDAAKLLAKELNTALTALAPWGKAIQGKSANDAVEIKKAAKIRWANDMRPGAKPIAAFGELSVNELMGLIAKAKSGEMPSMGAEDDLPPWAETDIAESMGDKDES